MNAWQKITAGVVTIGALGTIGYFVIPRDSEEAAKPAMKKFPRLTEYERPGDTAYQDKDGSYDLIMRLDGTDGRLVEDGKYKAVVFVKSRALKSTEASPLETTVDSSAPAPEDKTAEYKTKIKELRHQVRDMEAQLKTYTIR